MKNAQANPHESLPVEMAERIISEWIMPVDGQETLPVMEALMRVLSEEIVSPVDVPLYNNSAMDGYAFSAAGLDLAMPQRLKIAGSAHAGHRFTGIVAAGECVEIMTGGMVPAGCDTVAPLENVSVADGIVTIAANQAAAGDNVRLRGEEIKAKSRVFARGTRLLPAHLALLASLGISEVAVTKRLKVAIFSTGDELRAVGQPLQPGEIHDSNRYALHGMLSRTGCEVMDLGIVADDPALMRQALLKAAQEADAIVTTGGVSVGVADYTKAVMSELGEIAFWNINMRPGRPMAFGRMEGAGRPVYLFGLPGNPVAVMVSFYFFVRNALFYLMGTRPAPLPRITARTLSALSKRRGRTEFQRGILSPDEHGEWVVRTTGPQGSAMLSSMTAANCMIVLPAEGGAVTPGEKVEVVMFEGLV